MNEPENEPLSPLQCKNMTIKKIIKEKERSVIRYNLKAYNEITYECDSLTIIKVTNLKQIIIFIVGF